MIDISGKISTLRTSSAMAVVKAGNPETIQTVIQKKVPKGDVIEAARVAGLFAIKNTSSSIPDCHPIPIEFSKFDFEIDEAANEIKIYSQVHTIYKTGVEVEAMHGAAIAAITIYDMLKPIDKNIEIHSVKLVKKSGGKSDYTDKFRKDLSASVIVCSDSIASGKKEDKAGKAIIKKLNECNVKIDDYIIIPDEVEGIRKTVLDYCERKIDLVILTGGTGLSPRDVTPEAIRPILDIEIPGIAEAARNYGQDRTPYSMLSRSVAGLKGKTLIIALPGSTKGAAESMDALFPFLLHIFRIMQAARHD